MVANDSTEPLIVMAEDNPGDVLLMRTALEEVGLAVELDVVGDGVSAVVRLLDETRRRPDLVILNFNLPKIPGHEVLETVRQTGRLAGLPVVIVTSSDRERDRALCISADAYLVKGGDWKDMLRVARRIQEFIQASPSKRVIAKRRWEDEQQWRGDRHGGQAMPPTAGGQARPSDVRRPPV